MLHLFHPNLKLKYQKFNSINFQKSLLKSRQKIPTNSAIDPKKIAKNIYGGRI
ncbi:hypothetical protein CHY_0950 [Carboxydothermus hydrogenoformans Z-2901]|uniref:Uncharacterized protein n=1 Tax=Carboxydothermus hydrogenoformans (strain ATCC BAA-161 / DSM 6008 / Z-2901) TaxID=246194 RepID=Q3ADI7_CARHZ|nr:hypothetical protein CHY_0950 [Carboxydothermus hydrogenoformans Z-2901]